MPDSAEPPRVRGWAMRQPGWIVRTAAEYLVLALAWAWRLQGQAGFEFWPYVPAVLGLWVLTRGAMLRRPGGPTVGSWLESNGMGLGLTITIAVLFLDLPFPAIPGLAAWSLAAMLAVELTGNRGVRRRIARWSLQRWSAVWPHLGELLAIVGTFWAWQRLTGIDPLPLRALAWIGGTAAAILVLTRTPGPRWRCLIAPAVVLLPVLWTYAGVPEGRPYSRLGLLVVLALAVPWLHRRLEEGPGRRSSRLAWIWVQVLAGVWLGYPLLHSQAVGAGDAQWYATVLADAIAQFHAGIFPPLIGQSLYAFNGSIFPGAFAPYYQAAGVGVHALTAGSLPVYSIQHLLAVGSIVGGMLAVHRVLRRQTQAPHAYCAAVALLYGASPAWLAAIYSMDMYMTVLTMPWLPLVFHGAMGCFQRLGGKAILATAVPLALVWLAHPPIGLWTTLVLAVVHAWRVARRRQTWAAELRWLLGSAGLFAALTCLPVASALSTEHASDAFRHAYVIETLAEHWRSAWLPVSRGAALITDQHLGWSVALLGLGGLLLGWRRRDAATRGFLLATALLFLLLVPIPTVQSTLWRWLPDFVKSITDNWPTQRLIPVLAGLLAVAGGAALLRPLKENQRMRSLLGFGLFAAVCWSLGEASKFHQRGRAVTASPEVSFRRLLPENTVLTRYAYHMFGHQPLYVTDGVMNPNLKQSLLDPLTLEPFATNVTAAAAGADTVELTLALDPATADPHDLMPGLHLRPGREYYLEFDFGGQDIPGTLLFRGDRLEREYAVNHGPGSTGLGRARGQRNFLSLWTTGDGVENVRIRFQPRDPRTVLAGPQAKLRLTEIHPALLPVQIDELSPFQASVRAPRDAWLETSRMYLPGYEAVYNGSPAEVRSSPQGLVLVRVPAGTGRVELTYRPPIPVRLALVITVLSWSALGVIPLILRWLPRPTPPPAQPRPGSWAPAGLPQAEG